MSNDERPGHFPDVLVLQIPHSVRSFLSFDIQHSPFNIS